MTWNPDDWLNIPQELQARPQWMVCERTGEYAKQPRTLRGVRADAKDPNNWSTFKEACAAAIDNGWCIGYCLSESDPYTVIDLDNKADRQDYWDYIKRIRSQLTTYIETSMSGKGLHAWLKGNIGPGRRKDFIEVYSQERYIIMTGDWHEDKPQYIIDDQEWLQGLLAHLPSPVDSTEIEDAAPVEDNVVVCERVMQSKYANKFRTLAIGGWQKEYPDHSDADYAFAQIMVEFTPSNRQIWEMFKDTELGKRYKNGRPRHPNSNLFLSNACAKARVRYNSQQRENPMLMNAANNYVNGHAAQNGHMDMRAEIGRHAAAPAGSNILRFPQPTLPSIVGYTEENILTRPDLEWVVKYIITRGELSVMWGEPKSGKSFLAMDLAYAVCEGKPWFGYRTIKMPVVYLMLEGSKGLKQRIEARRKHFGITAFNNNIVFIDHPFDLADPQQCQQLTDYLGKFNGLIIIDTLSRATPTMDENKSDDMGRIIAASELLGRNTESTTLLVHHSTKSTENPTMRGHSRLLGAVSGTIEVHKSDVKGESIWEPGEVKESGVDGGRRFAVKPVFLRTDKDGDAVQSCIVDPIKEEILDNVSGETVEVFARDNRDSRAHPKSERELKGGKYERIFNEQWAAMLRKFGKVASCSKGQMAVPIDAVYDHMTGFVIGSTAGNKKLAISRLLERLTGKEQWVCESDNVNIQWIWRKQ